MSVIIAFPNTATSLLLGSSCVSALYDVVFFMPTEIDMQFGNNIYHNVKVLSSPGDNDVLKTDIPDFSMPDVKIVFFPCLGMCFIII